MKKDTLSKSALIISFIGTTALCVGLLVGVFSNDMSYLLKGYSIFGSLCLLALCVGFYGYMFGN